MDLALNVELLLLQLQAVLLESGEPHTDHVTILEGVANGVDGDHFWVLILQVVVPLDGRVVVVL